MNNYKNKRLLPGVSIIVFKSNIDKYKVRMI